MRYLQLQSPSDDVGYYHVWITASRQQRFLLHIHDKSRFVECVSKSLVSSSHITLLGYALVSTGAHLLLHASEYRSLDSWTNRLLEMYSDALRGRGLIHIDTVTVFDKLAGRHEALAVSRDIHLLPITWRRSPYSSIRYYLDGMRSEWLNAERMLQLFDNQPDEYVRFLRSRSTESDRIFTLVGTNRGLPSANG